MAGKCRSWSSRRVPQFPLFATNRGGAPLREHSAGLGTAHHPRRSAREFDPCGGISAGRAENNAKLPRSLRPQTFWDHHESAGSNGEPQFPKPLLLGEQRWPQIFFGIDNCHDLGMSSISLGSGSGARGFLGFLSKRSVYEIIVSEFRVAAKL